MSEDQESVRVEETPRDPPQSSSQTSETESSQESEQPSVVPANAIKGGRETSDRVLYVGNLDKSITEDILKQYFQVGGQIANVKVMIDKNNSHANYAFVEYFKSHDANIALQTLNGKQIENNVVRINWAFQSQQATPEENTFNLFVGDLSVNVDDETLSNAFKNFPSFVQAHVMWDMQTGGSRGYGFVSFSDRQEAQSAMDAMQSCELNGRPLRINWASKRENNHNHRMGGGAHHRRGGGGGTGGPGGGSNFGPRATFRQFNTPYGRGMPMPPPNTMGMPLGAVPPTPQAVGGPSGPASAVPPPVSPQAVEAMIRRAPPRVTTSYIGNIPHFATEADLIPLLQNFGFILDFKHYPEKGCCFVKYDTHEQAAVCIVALANFPFQGRNLRTGWGKGRTSFVPMPQQGLSQMQQPMMMADQGDQQQQPSEY
ncbi:ZYBA0S04-05886g1_1 [Zygosaccharomyces bailii CLIB 213]|uniref:ZYBA0S04-05886g1_1 n=1 Tax=Zygosaccharomyces bailii (strain CLIB 213 / ATCC 58445 / CBS 680 / BCRC 21525 / NBRC 1098 / NCYC 1416 / NRRL Y-2227) TaxID=1333698 RepID=A0A8J2X800_ZYGB2|nr:ZYBA0S04-05886g1_1 [Zygosaccharomyces bailii CLIB 213]